MMFLGGIINALVKLCILVVAAGIGIFAGKQLRERKDSKSQTTD